MPRPKRPWFRFYVEAIHDPKLRRIPPAQRWLWVAVMCAARESPVPGYLLITAADDDVEPVTDEDLADAAAVRLGDVQAGVAWFLRMGMLVVDAELDCYVVKHWGDRQFETDEVAQRTRKHRAERNGSGFVGTSLERSYVVDRNAVTPFPGTLNGRSRERPQRTEDREQRTEPLKFKILRVTQEVVHRRCGRFAA